ncbi:hypothetical protein CTI12_AA101410 [Artemisia annua]|uniref:Helitron helicase-like domain-containing protein n=1 Tax=Artemisia annua TaxID=35608 RepID=A0A2U1N3D8_ARTAN|nr:hypothetical protein CTI12_AA101410 [Artemisia annua]
MDRVLDLNLPLGRTFLTQSELAKLLNSAYLKSVEPTGDAAAHAGSSPPKAGSVHLDEPMQKSEETEPKALGSMPMDHLMKELELSAAHQATLKKNGPECQHLRLHSIRGVVPAAALFCERMENIRHTLWRGLREDIVEGLIQFLNQKNTLVRLFHTARDKLQEADIPEFQIRLFGVIGANQYELPTADAIGAIVYDGGPESMIEYDVIIQRHSGEAESVNKLHPAWHCSFLFSLFTVNKAII